MSLSVLRTVEMSAMLAEFNGGISSGRRLQRDVGGEQLGDGADSQLAVLEQRGVIGRRLVIGQQWSGGQSVGRHDCRTTSGYGQCGFWRRTHSK